MRRTVRKSIEAGLPLVGTVVVFVGILAFMDITMQIIVAAIGIVMIQAGIWNLTQPILPSERKYQALRREVDNLIRLVRRLNAAAVGMKELDNADTRAVFDATQARMRESLERIAVLAGKTDEEVRALRLDDSVPAATAQN